ncbi:hypothetical protein [Pedosphaera parvula]|nr:hypothetical protein [Pedosphaera parvula]
MLGSVTHHSGLFVTYHSGSYRGYFLCKRLAGVGAEMSLTVLAYNLKRVLNIVSLEDLIKAVAVKE